MPSRLPIFYLEFPTQHLVTTTFLRFQEHYESPRFAGKFFSLETYMDWYAATRGSFSYLTDWGGFNIPSSVLAPFRAGNFGRLSMKERALLKVLPATSSPFYVIATYASPHSAVTMARHIVYGYSFLCPAYSEAASEHISLARGAGVPKLHALLMELGYDSIVDEEINAYMLTGLPRMRAKTAKSLEPLRLTLRAVFRKHFGFEPEYAALARTVTRIPYSRFARELCGQKEVWET